MIVDPPQHKATIQAEAITHKAMLPPPTVRAVDKGDTTQKNADRRNT